MASTLQKLYATREKYGDMTFVVESERIRVHRCIVAATSKTLEDYLNGLDSRAEEIIVKNVSASVFNEFIKFCYSCEMIFSNNNVEGILQLAKQWQLNCIVDYCEKFLVHSLHSIEKVCWAYNLAIENDLTSVQQLCESKINKKTPAVFTTWSFLNCNRETLTKILSLRSLNCSSFEVMKACISWAKRVCQKENRDDQDPNMLRTTLGDLITLIPFGSMTIQDFYGLNKEYEGIFRPLKCIEITTHILNGEINLNGEIFEEMRKRSRIVVEESVKQEPTIKQESWSDAENYRNEQESESTSRKIPLVIQIRTYQPNGNAERHQS